MKGTLVFLMGRKLLLAALITFSSILTACNWMPINSTDSTSISPNVEFQAGWATYTDAIIDHNGTRDAVSLRECIYDFAFTSKGAIWLATSYGALLFNGKEWKRFTTENGLPDNETRNISVASNGTVWVSSLRGIADTISSYDGRKWIVHDYGEIGWFIDFAQDGAFWAWSYEDSAIRYHAGTEWKSYPKQEFWFPQKLITTPDGNVWVFNPMSERRDGPTGIFRFDGQKWDSSSVGNAWITGMASSPEGKIWVAADSCLFCLENGSWELQTTIPDGSFVRDMVFDTDGTLWTLVGESGKAWKFTDDEWTEFPIPNSVAYSIGFAPDGAIWFVTDVGLMRYSDN